MFGKKKKQAEKKIGTLKRRKRKSLAKSMLRIVISVAIIIFVVSTILNWNIFRVQSSLMMERQAYNAAVAVRLDVFSMGDFEPFSKAVMETYRSIPEEIRLSADDSYYAYFEKYENSPEYQQMREELLHLSEQFMVEDTYLAMYDENTQALVYLLDPPEPEATKSSKVGEWLSVDSKKFGEFLDEMENQSGSDTYTMIDTGNRFGERVLETGVPIRDDAGNIYAIALTDLPVVVMTVYTTIFTVLFLIVMLAIIVLLVVLVRIFMRKRVTIPVRSIADAAERYIYNKREGRTERCFDHLDIQTGDELEELGNVMSGMETDIAEFEDDLMQATAERERMQTELSVATRIQNDMLPTQFPAFPGRKEFDIYAIMDPAKEVGGDFYDLFLIDDDHLGLVMADVSGKGIPAALFMMSSMIIINNYASEGYSPATVLEKANERICATNMTDMFVTVWFGSLDLKSGLLVAASAGHEYPAIMHAGGTYELYHDPHGFVMGGMTGIRYKEYTISLEKGSRIFVYTDGVPEAADADNRMYGTQRMLQALNRNREKTQKELLDAVRADIDRFVKDAPQFDDLTMMGVEYFG